MITSLPLSVSRCFQQAWSWTWHSQYVVLFQTRMFSGVLLKHYSPVVCNQAPRELVHAFSWASISQAHLHMLKIEDTMYALWYVLGFYH